MTGMQSVNIFTILKQLFRTAEIQVIQPRFILSSPDTDLKIKLQQKQNIFLARRRHVNWISLKLVHSETP